MRRSDVVDATELMLRGCVCSRTCLSVRRATDDTSRGRQAADWADRRTDGEAAEVAEMMYAREDTRACSDWCCLIARCSVDWNARFLLGCEGGVDGATTLSDHRPARVSEPREYDGVLLSVSLPWCARVRRRLLVMCSWQRLRAGCVRERA